MFTTFTMTDFFNLANSKDENLTIHFRDDCKLSIDGRIVSKRLTKYLMTLPHLRSFFENEFLKYDASDYPPSIKIVKKMMRKYA